MIRSSELKLALTNPLAYGLGVFMWICFSSVSFAQQFPINTNPTITTCAGVLEDSGGPSGSYGNGENFTTVICPDQPGDGISLMWVIFDLSTQGPNPLDRIRIWDGNSTTATSLGEYTGTQLQGLVASATTFNATGCLTVQFISNGNGVGDFAAAISCFTPCDRPEAVATMTEDAPALICQGEEVSFDGTASYAAPGFNIVQYTWVFGDGTTADGPTATHAFTEPGEYVVQLNLIDDNDCVNSNVVDLQILVSTTPSFNGSVESTTTCLGAEVDLFATVTPTTWTGMPESNFGAPLDLPDDVGIPFTSELVFTQFEPGQTLNNVSDFLSICVSMEHTFMGDLVLSLTCPNGQNVIMHQQGGGGTFLGDANDGDGGGNIVPGTCWDYCWSPTAALGTWADCAQFGATPNVTAVSQGTALVEGTYASVQPFSNLVGCPLNGSWTFTSTDLWAADNGTICAWSINFSPSIIPEATQFTPDLGTSTLDSASWTGPFLVLNPNDPLDATASPTDPGSYDYTFSVTDNHGCQYDTTINVTIDEPMEIDAGPDIVLCNDPLPMAGEVISAAPTSCQWVLELYESFGDTWNGGATLAVTIDGVTNNYTISAAGVTLQTHLLDVQQGSTISLNYTAGTVWNNENSFALFNDIGGSVYASPTGPPSGVAWSGTANCGGSNIPSHEIEWTPSDGLDDPNELLTNVFVTQPTWYYLAVYPTGHPECAVIDSVLVSPDPSIEPGVNTVLSICANELTFSMTDALDGTPDAGGVWTLNGVVVQDEFDPMNGTAGTYVYTITSAAGCTATSELDITIIPTEDPTCCGIVAVGPSAISCDLTNELTVSPGNTGVGNWSGPAGAIFDNMYSATTNVTMPAGSGGEHWFYWIEDDGAFCYLIDSVQMTFTDAIVIDITTTDAICYSYCDGTANAEVTGGNIAGGYDLQWSTGVGATTEAITDLCAGQVTLTVTDDNGCSNTASAIIFEPALLEVDSMATIPVTCSGLCDGQVMIYDAEAVEYSFNDGASWSVSNIQTEVCEGVYPILIRDAIGCVGSGSTTVTGPPPVIAGFEWGPQDASVDQPMVTFYNTSANATTYNWNVSGLMQTTDPEFSYTFSHIDPADYNVCLIAYNANQCSDTVCQFVEIEDVLFTYIPSGFTPNGDNLNDAFKISVNIDVITDFSMVIFDRWGQVVFETKDIEDGWLGSHKNSGEVLSTNVYVYMIEYGVHGSDTRREIMGHLTLMK